MSGNLKVGLTAVVSIFVMVGLARSCGYGAPLVIPDWADSLRLARQQYSVDSLRLAQAVHTQAILADSLKREADSWRRRSLASRPARPRLEPDSAQTVPDSALISRLRANNDSLWTALDAADSAYSSLDSAFQSQRQATADALAWKDREHERGDSLEAVGKRAIGDLTSRLRKAQRGSRLFGLIPLPSLYAGLGATLEGGRVATGPTVGIGVKVAF